MKRFKSIHTCFISFFGVLVLFGLFDAKDADIQFVPEYTSFTQLAELPLKDLPKRTAWQKAAPDVVDIEIPRQNAAPAQPALWYHSGTKKKKPLLLVLHSWSADYLQHYGIPYAVFAQRNDWIFIHPNYRGKFDDADATGSEKAVQDVLDALKYAKNHAPVDEDRIYLAGFSGGAMMSLIIAGRYPDRFTAALAWVPVYDLNDWYSSVKKSEYAYTDHYQKDLEAACGGNPQINDAAKNACRKRSPSTYLSKARGNRIQVFIGGGIKDHFVPPSHAVRAFNDLAEEKDRISEADYVFIDKNESLPEGLKGQGQNNRFFKEADLPVVFARKSRNGVLFLFDGGHDIFYNAGFEWLSRQNNVSKQKGEYHL